MLQIWSYKKTFGTCKFLLLISVIEVNSSSDYVILHFFNVADVNEGGFCIAPFFSVGTYIFLMHYLIHLVPPPISW